jgi:predicted dehydrogenase
MRKKFVQVGIGSRAGMYYTALARQHRESGDLLAICDNNPGRLELCARQLKDLGLQVKTYQADQFDRMLAEIKPDCVIVTSKDATHDEYLCSAMRAGCDVITEKPMTTDAAKCQRIIDTQRETGRRCTVTFNYRYSPPRTQIKELLMSGVIGNIVSVDFQWLLDTRHGADYFRRWHRQKENSGGLLVHKSTHHFDLVNWWLSSIPVNVFATGERSFYTPQTAERYGLHRRGERCLDCAESARCAFFLDLRGDAPLRRVYLENEAHDGYFRDRCVFSPGLDIQDNMHVIAKYASGAIMSYSLHAFMPWEGYTVAFNGTCGRIEHRCVEAVYGTPGEHVPVPGNSIYVYPQFESAYALDVWQGAGGHGGGDGLLLDDIFRTGGKDDKYRRAADQRAGAYSILTGIAANRSIAEGRTVAIADLVQNIGVPDYTAMPGTLEALAMPKNGNVGLSPAQVRQLGRA